MGCRTTASGSSSTAMGFNTTASAESSTAMGSNTTASGSRSTAMGLHTTASGWFSTAMGDYTTASGTDATAMGQRTRASGDNSTAMGFYTIANRQYHTVIGMFNDTTATSGLFIIGNGSGPSTRTNAMVVYTDGHTEFGGNVIPMANTYNLGNYTASGRWKNIYLQNQPNTTSDKRLKTNIKPLERALDKVLTLNGVTYNWRVAEFPQMNFDNDTHVGVLAQELEAVLPEAVETSEDGYKSVRYGEITPLLIEAIKEQQAIIENQQAKIDNQQKKIEELEAANSKLQSQIEQILEKLK